MMNVFIRIIHIPIQIVMEKYNQEKSENIYIVVILIIVIIKILILQHVLKKKAFGEVLSEMNGCEYENYDDDHCSTDIVQMKEEKTTCANIRAAFKDSMDCDCKITSAMYKEASSEYKKLWDKQQPAINAGGNLIEWNEAL
eukprot:533960_1